MSRSILATAAALLGAHPRLGAARARPGSPGCARTPRSSWPITPTSFPTPTSARAQRWHRRRLEGHAGGRPGPGTPERRNRAREVAKVSKNAELYIVSTHFHAEHTTGYLAFPPTAKYVNSTTQEKEFEESGMQMVKTFSGRSPADRRDPEGCRAAPRRHHVRPEYTLDLGGVRVRFLVVGPTHTRGDTGFFVEGDSVLFAGDVVMNESFLAARAASSMKAWLAAFDAFAAFKPRSIVPAHGAVGPGTLDRDQPRVGATGTRPGTGAESPGQADRRDRDHGPGRIPGAASGMAARQRARGAGAGRLRGSLSAQNRIRAPSVARRLHSTVENRVAARAADRVDPQFRRDADFFGHHHVDTGDTVDAAFVHRHALVLKAIAVDAEPEAAVGPERRSAVGRALNGGERDPRQPHASWCRSASVKGSRCGTSTTRRPRRPARSSVPRPGARRSPPCPPSGPAARRCDRQCPRRPARPPSTRCR